VTRAAAVLFAAAVLCGAAGAAQPSPWKSVTVQKSSGGVTAVMTVERRKTKYDATDSRNLHLTVKVDGKTVLDKSLCNALRCGIAAQQTLSLARLSGGMPDVVLDYYTGGAHCCFWSLIVVPSGKTLVHDWGDAGYRIVHYRGAPQLVSADDRFAYEFTSFAASGLPVQVWAITPDGALSHPDVLENVTETRLDLVKKDAAVWWKAYVSQRGKPDADVRGVLAAWCADQYRLGQRPACGDELAKALVKGWIKGEPDWPSNGKYIALVHKDLAAWGYPLNP
jgi:hypothetical protein